VLDSLPRRSGERPQVLVALTDACDETVPTTFRHDCHATRQVRVEPGEASALRPALQPSASRHGRRSRSRAARETLLLPLWGFAWRCPWRRGRLRLGHWHRLRLGRRGGLGSPRLEWRRPRWLARTRRVTRVWHGDRDLAPPRRARLTLDGRQPALDDYSDHLTLRQGQPRELHPSAILLAAGQGLRGRREASEMESAAGTFSRGYARGTRKGAPAHRER
jgi:hypothetical protein